MHDLSWPQAVVWLWRSVKEDPGMLAWIAWGFLCWTAILAGAAAIVVHALGLT